MRANVSQKMFPSLPTLGNITKHRQGTMFLQQCFLVCPGLYISELPGKAIMQNSFSIQTKVKPSKIAKQTESDMKI